MNEPREYKNQSYGTGVIILVFGIALFAVLAISVDKQLRFIMLPFAGIIFLFFLVTIFFSTSKVYVSNDEIASKNLFGTNTLKWNEIARVSGSGNTIKLHNADGDITVSPSARLAGYEEIVE
jgi:hypothetical protein